MKASTTFSLICLFSIITIAGIAKDETLQLKLQEGQKILFSYSRTSNQIEENELFGYVMDEKWIQEIHVGQSAGEKLLISVFPQRYIFNRFSNAGPDVHYDSMFPPAAGQSDDLKELNIKYGILEQLELRMELAATKNQIKLVNEEELSHRIEKELIKRNIGQGAQKVIKKQITADIEKIRLITSKYLLTFTDATYHSKDSLQLSSNDFLISRQEKLLKLKREAVYAGNQNEKLFQSAIIDQETGLVMEFLSVTSGTKKEKKFRPVPKSKKELFLLLKDSETFNPITTISGRIEQPDGRYVRIRVLKDPAGKEMKTYRAVLDSNNHFSLTIPLQRETFLFFANTVFEQQQTNVIPHVIYAEPGDHIIFDMAINGNDRVLKNKGDHSAENNLLFTFRPYIEEKIKNFLFGISVNFIVSITPEKITDLNELSDFIKKDQAREISENSSLSPLFRQYLSGEIMMEKLEMVNSLFYFSGAFAENTDLTPGYKAIYRDLKLFSDTFHIARYYNENGYFSRSAISTYASTRFSGNKRYSSPSSLDFRTLKRRPENILNQKEQLNNYLDLILCGSALAREKTGILSASIIYPGQFNSFAREKWFAIQSKIGNEVKDCSGDSFLNRFIDDRLLYAQEFLNGSVYKKKIFINQDGDTVSIDQLTGGKPVFLYISGDWAASRYYVDRLSKEHPEAVFFFLVSGNDYQKWKDYLKRAEPKAHQLFLPEGNNNLKDLFSINDFTSRMVVFGINGKIVDDNADSDLIEKYLTEALNPVIKEGKKTNNAVLLWIIGLLSGIIALFLTGFLIFKYRIKIKMKKQEQVKRLRELQLSSIRSQMNPHFLFNSLNSVQNLILKEKGREAHLYLADLAGLIRKILQNSQKEEVSLAEELETVNQYIRLEQLRFDFRFEQFIDEKVDQNNFMVPSMILQPIVENAIMHGLQEKAGDKILRLKILKKEHHVCIRLEDNGIGIKASKKQKTMSNGIGLSLNEERLKLMEEKYGEKYSIQITDLYETGKEGTLVEIVLPDEE